MNREYILKNTESFDDYLMKVLKDPEEAKLHLEVALEEYQKDKDITAFLFSLQNVARAQGGIGKLAKKVGITREHLYSVLSSKHKPRLDNLLSIISGLGFRIRIEQKDKVTA